MIGQEGAWGDCQSCEVPISAATFARRADTWVADWQDRTDSMGLGIIGHTQSGEMVQVGPDRHGFVFRRLLTGPGFSVNTLEVFGEANGHFAQLAVIAFHSESLVNPAAA